MSYEDKSLKCTDCGAAFTFTAGEQEFFATKGYTNEPKRCQTCRRAKNQQKSSSSYGSPRNYSTG
ncbi:MAG: zinc-ribbon domain-containing protein [Dehalococcoidia bacterium]|nr:zinc-ribbon domain-containing protein [Dehalococcoidia bacterium]